MISSNQASYTTKPPQAPKLRRDPMAESEKTASPKLPIHNGSIFRWRPSQSLGFQIAAVTAVTANSATGHKPWNASTSAYSSSYIADQSTVSTHSAFPSSSNDSATTPQGYHSTFFVLSKIDPWGPMAIFAPQLKVGMRIVAINRQPCPKTPEGLHALLDSEHTEAKFSPNMVHPALYDNQEENTPDSSYTGWITIHAVDLEEELTQRQYYLNRVERRGLEPDEQRSEQSSEASPLLDDIREDEDEEGINVIRVEIVTKGQELNPEDQDFRQKLKALHFLEEKRQRALFHEAQAKKKEKCDRRRDKQLGYMASNIWDMKIRTEEGDVAALDNFSLLPAVASRKPESKRTKTQLQKDIEAIEKWQDAKALKEIQKKVQSIEQGEPESVQEKKKKKKKGKKEKKETEEKSEKTSDWNLFEAVQTMLLSSPPPPPASQPSQAKSKSTIPPPSIFDESMGSTMASTISTKSGSEYQAWFAGWGMTGSDEESVSSIIENAPKKLLLKASISPQQWFCGTATASVKKTEKKTQQKLKMPREVQCIKKDPAGSMKRDPEGARAAVDVGCESNQPKQTQLQKPGKRDMRPESSAPEGLRAAVDVGCPSNQPKLTQLRKLGKQAISPKRSAPEGVRAAALHGIQAPVGSPRSNQPKQTQLQKVGKRDMGPAWSAQLGSYSDSMSTKTTGATKSTHRTTVEELRQLVARIERNEQTQNHKQLHKPVGKATHLRNRALPPIRPVQQPVISLVDRSVPSYVQAAPSSSASIVSKLGDGRELQGTTRSNAEMTLLKTEQKPKRKQTKTSADGAANTTTAFTLPASRSKSSDEKKKQLKKLQATWKAARARKAKEAKRAVEAEARQANGTPEWGISSLFQSFFQCA